MNIISPVFRGTVGMSVASNALLAEHALPELGAEQRDCVRKQVLHIMKSNGTSPASPAFVEDRFNASARAVQLNLLALAMSDLHIKPCIGSERWAEVRYPFQADNYRIGNFLTVQQRLLRRHGIRVPIREQSLNLAAI